jgi:hypothetical protein
MHGLYKAIHPQEVVYFSAQTRYLFSFTACAFSQKRTDNKPHHFYCSPATLCNKSHVDSSEKFQEAHWGLLVHRSRKTSWVHLRAGRTLEGKLLQQTFQNIVC